LNRNDEILNADMIEALEKSNGADEQTALGRLYYEGRYLTQDYKKARECFERALEKDPDFAEALDYLGYCHYYGREIPVDYETALACFEKSAEQGDRVGLYKLGDLYRDGKAVRQDRDHAMRLYSMALDHSTDDSPEIPGICLRIAELLLDRAQNYLEHPESVSTELALDAALNASEILGRSEARCWKLLSQGDPYAHLSLPGIKNQIDRSRIILGQMCESCNSRVFYPNAPGETKSE
jgi:tetratricopeptide (TPR) repeat protein